MQIENLATQASMRALITLLEGREQAARDTAFYHAYVGFDPALVQAATQATIALGRDAIISLFDPSDVAGGPKEIGIALDQGKKIQLRFGRLWMSPDADRAVIVPYKTGKNYSHFACEKDRFVRRACWPAKDLARGIERAEARLAELTIELALAPV